MKFVLEHLQIVFKKEKEKHEDRIFTTISNISYFEISSSWLIGLKIAGKLYVCNFHMMFYNFM